MNDTGIDLNSIYTSIVDGSTINAMPIVGSSTISTSSVGSSVEDILDEWEMNRVTFDHKVTAQELLKLKEVAPDFANEIKDNIAKNIARDVIKKVTFKKKHDIDSDVTHFIGRVWVFTDEEIKNLLERR